MPSLNHRGIRFRVACKVTTWQNSCHNTDCQLVPCAAVEAGLFAVTTRPKHTPRKPATSGIPKVLTAKSFGSAKISTSVGFCSSAPYFPTSAVCARANSAMTSCP